MSQSSRGFSFSRNTVGVNKKLIIPIGKNLDNASTSTLPPSIGSIAFNAADGAYYVGTTSGWAPCSQTVT